MVETILLGLLLLVLELRPGPREAPRITLKQDGLGRVTVARDGVRELVDREAARVADRIAPAGPRFKRAPARSRS